MGSRIEGVQGIDFGRDRALRGAQKIVSRWIAQVKALDPAVISCVTVQAFIRSRCRRRAKKWILYPAIAKEAGTTPTGRIVFRMILIALLSTSFATRQVVARNLDSTQAEFFQTIRDYGDASAQTMDALVNITTRHFTAADATPPVNRLPTTTGVNPTGNLRRDPHVVRLAQVSTTEANATVTSPDTDATVLGISEMLLGVVDHDAGIISDNTEGGAAFTAELRFKPLRGQVFEFLRSPRPHLGFNLNTSGNTSALYAGLTWLWPFGNRYFFSFAFGGAVHDGTLKTNNREKRKNNKQLGCRFLFREAVELGFTFLKQHALSIRFDHLSNANLCDNNEGLDTVGLVYGYRF